MRAQAATAELRRWITDQARAGSRVDEMLAAMRASGWREEVAVEALERALRDVLDAPAGPAEPPRPKSMPGLDLANSPTTMLVGGREVQVLASLRSPRLVVLGGLLSNDECEQLVASARPRLVRSETVVYATGASEVHGARTSRGMFFGRGETALCELLERRIASLTNWPVENGEGLQVLCYGEGSEYRPHYDHFDPAQPGMASVLARGGQRLATLVIYLNTPRRGGGTVFPDLGLEVAPHRGNAVFFSYDRTDPSTRTLHGGAVVLEGEKWVATKWLREGRFD